MKLMYTTPSPFVRKVTVTAIECGLEDRVERIVTDISDHDGVLHTINPVSKVPALVLDDGSMLADSRVICAYLDSLHDGHKLIPADGDARWRALGLEALVDDLVDAAILYRVEDTRRPEGTKWPAWGDKQLTKAARGLDWINQHIELLDGPLNIGQITLACHLGWIRFRMALDLLTVDRPALMAWFAEFEKRPSMQATMPE